MDTKSIQKKLLKHLCKRKDFLVFTTNLSLELAFEADVIMVNKYSEIYEFEIKISRNDFFKDYKKNIRGVLKHNWMKGENILNDFYQKKRPNKFFYVCPYGLIKKNEIPKEFGLIEVFETGQVCITKLAKQLHKNKCENDLIISISRNFCIKQALENER